MILRWVICDPMECVVFYNNVIMRTQKTIFLKIATCYSKKHSIILKLWYVMRSLLTFIIYLKIPMYLSAEFLHVCVCICQESKEKTLLRISYWKIYFLRLVSLSCSLYILSLHIKVFCDLIECVVFYNSIILVRWKNKIETCSSKKHSIFSKLLICEVELPSWFIWRLLSISVREVATEFLNFCIQVCWESNEKPAKIFFRDPVPLDQYLCHVACIFFHHISKYKNIECVMSYFSHNWKIAIIQLSKYFESLLSVS